MEESDTSSAGTSHDTSHHQQGYHMTYVRYHMTYNITSLFRQTGSKAISKALLTSVQAIVNKPKYREFKGKPLE